MSIPQTPILYTGKNVAVPDWKSFNKELNARFDMVRREKQQQRQFETQQQAQLNREFLRNVDVDRINFANANIQQQSANVYNRFDDAVATMVETKKGELSIQDIMNGRALASRANQEITKFKSWESNWMKDMQAINDPRISGKFSDESKASVVNYDGKAPYSETRLQIKPWDAIETEQKLNKSITNSNEVSAFSYLNGQGDIKTKEEYTERFWQTEAGIDGIPRLVRDANGDAIPKWNEQIKYVKGVLTSNEFSQGRIGVVDRFEALSPEQKTLWEDIAKNNGLDEEDAPIMHFMKDNNPFTTKRVITEQKISPTAKKSYFYSYGGDRTDINLEESDKLTYGGQQFENVYQLGTKKVKLGKGYTIKGAKEAQGNKLVSVDDKVYDDAEVVGVNMTNGKAKEVIFSVPEKGVDTDKEGNILYVSRAGREQTLDQWKKTLPNMSEDEILLQVSPKQSKKRTIVVAPAENNTEALKGFVVNKQAVTPLKGVKKEDEKDPLGLGI
jgi:hypothetical protein